MKKRSKYRYFSEIKWAEKFMDGELRFRSLSHFKKLEDGEVRGDAGEGSISYKPEGGLIMHHEHLGKSFTFPGAIFGSAVKTAEIFVLCGSNSMTDELRIRLKARACVQRIEVYRLPGGFYSAAYTQFIAANLQRTALHWRPEPVVLAHSADYDEEAW